MYGLTTYPHVLPYCMHISPDASLPNPVRNMRMCSSCLYITFIVLCGKQTKTEITFKNRKLFQLSLLFFTCFTIFTLNVWIVISRLNIYLDMFLCAPIIRKCIYKYYNQFLSFHFHSAKGTIINWWWWRLGAITQRCKNNRYGCLCLWSE